MGRFVLAGLVSCLALCLAAPIAAAEDVEGEIAKLKQEVQELRAAQLEQDINAYLAETKGWEGAQGGDGLKGVTLHASFTAVFQGTLGVGDPGADVGVADGDFDLNFDLQVSDNVSLFMNMTANNGGTGSLPLNFFTTGIALAPTLAGLTDGMDVNGTVPTNPGAVATNEVGVRVATNIGDTVLHWEMGEIDPRHRFLQNGFTTDNNTRFIHNSFTDSASVLWLTDASGRTSLGWYMWIEFGNEKQFNLSWGWFNTPGEWFKNGQFYLQFAWKGEVSGREMNVRLMAMMNEFFSTGAEDDSASFGGEWDWWVTEKIALVFTGVFTNGDVNPVDYDFTFAGIFQGLISSRPDDQFGAGIVFTTTNDAVITLLEDTEFGFELYYTLMLGDGKIQVTPHLIYVMDPGGGEFPGGAFVEDALFILGVRMYVPF